LLSIDQGNIQEDHSFFQEEKKYFLTQVEGRFFPFYFREIHLMNAEGRLCIRFKLSFNRRSLSKKRENIYNQPMQL